MASSHSNWMTNKLKNFDFLGEGINFTIHNEPHLKTVCGGILRVILYLIGIFLAFYFGKDFIGKKNPQVYFEVKNSLELVNITYTAEDFFFAVHFENFLGKNIDVSDYFYISATLNEYKNSESIYTLKTTDIPMVRCTNMTFDDDTEEFFKKRNEKEYYCPVVLKESPITVFGLRI